MLNFKLNAGRGLHLAAVAPRMRKLPNRCYVIISQCRGVKGDRLCPLLHSFQYFEFHINGKGIQQIQKLNHLLEKLSRNDKMFQIKNLNIRFCWNEPLPTDASPGF